MGSSLSDSASFVTGGPFLCGGQRFGEVEQIRVCFRGVFGVGAGRLAG